MFEVHFKTKEQVKKRSTVTLRKFEWLLLPLYKRRTSKTKINNVPLEADNEKLVATVTYGRSEGIIIIDTEVTEEVFWTG